MEVNTNKTELLNISRSKTTAATIEKIKATTLNLQISNPMTRGYGKIAIEPLQEMKRFKAID
jgi:hypothetical protein